jgi:hypothetical protein
MVEVGAFSIFDTVFSQSKATRGGQQLQTHVPAFASSAVVVHGSEQQLILPAYTLRIAAQQSGRKSRSSRQLVGVEQRQPKCDVIGLERGLSVAEKFVEDLMGCDKAAKGRGERVAKRMGKRRDIVPCPG